MYFTLLLIHNPKIYYKIMKLIILVIINSLFLTNLYVLPCKEEELILVNIFLTKNTHSIYVYYRRRL